MSDIRGIDDIPRALEVLETLIPLIRQYVSSPDYADGPAIDAYKHLLEHSTKLESLLHSERVPEYNQLLPTFHKCLDEVSSHFSALEVSDEPSCPQWVESELFVKADDLPELSRVDISSKLFLSAICLSNQPSDDVCYVTVLSEIRDYPDQLYSRFDADLARIGLQIIDDVDYRIDQHQDFKTIFVQTITSRVKYNLPPDVRAIVELFQLLYRQCLVSLLNLPFDKSVTVSCSHPIEIVLQKLGYIATRSGDSVTLHVPLF